MLVSASRLVCISTLRNHRKEFMFQFLVQDKSSFLLTLEDTENWLYEDGEDQQKQVYVDRLASLKVC